MSKHPLLSKLLAIAVLMAILTLALAFVRGTITERSAYRQDAANEVAAAHAGAQAISGPLIWWPYTESHKRWVKVEGESGRMREETAVEEKTTVVFPTRLDFRSALDFEQRRRGIFPVTVYTSRHSGTGQFVVPNIAPQRPGAVVTLGKPLLLMGVSDARGLLRAPALRLAGRALAVERAPASAPLPLAAAIDPASLAPGASVALELSFELAGTGRIGWVPLAAETSVVLGSPWPHPSFGGSFLPRTRTVGAQGFEAAWRVSSLSTRAQAQFLASEGKLQPEQFSVALADPVDPYRLAERAVKYGLLFVMLSFAAIFVLEVLRRWRIHPMQYGMVGAALVLFFLLLLSLAEQIAFVAAYALASTACILLLAFYLRHVLGGWRASGSMSVLLVALYGVLYGVLISEDNALLLGSLLLFGVLSAVMTATRRLDWYRVLPAEPTPTVRRPAERSVPTNSVPAPGPVSGA